MTEMTYQDWQEKIEKGCPAAVMVGQGGSYCRLKDGTRGYCMYAYCHRREDK